MAAWEEAVDSFLTKWRSNTDVTRTYFQEDYMTSYVFQQTGFDGPPECNEEVCEASQIGS